MAKLAINGFGRIGRVALRILLERSNLNVIAINDLASADELAYLLKYDSVHGRLAHSIYPKDNYLWINDQKIQIFNEKDPANLPWKDLGVDIVLESSGHFLSKEQASKHLIAGAKKVVISAPSTNDSADATICYGVNNEAYKPNMTVISTASCTTNCIAPLAKILDDNLGIKKALVTTIHSYTNDQNLLDLPHKDKRRSRAAALSLIPTTTGAARAIALVLPDLKNKFDGIAIRVPTPNVSLVDMVVEVQKDASAEQINGLFEKYSKSSFKNILDICYEPLVSIDFNGSSYSSIVDAKNTMVIDKNLVKVLAWYDNEWGFTNRAVDLLEMVSLN